MAASRERTSFSLNFLACHGVCSSHEKVCLESEYDVDYQNIARYIRREVSELVYEAVVVAQQNAAERKTKDRILAETAISLGVGLLKSDLAHWECSRRGERFIWGKTYRDTASRPSLTENL